MFAEEIDPHTLLIYVHLVLFVYWLGPDWGVYVTTHYICKAGLPIEERRRFLAAMLRIDLVPRSCLILLFPVGLTLADGLGLSPVTGAWLLLVWVLFPVLVITSRKFWPLCRQAVLALLFHLNLKK